MVPNMFIRKSTMLFIRMRDIFEKIIISLKSRIPKKTIRNWKSTSENNFLRQEMFFFQKFRNHLSCQYEIKDYNEKRCS